MANPTGTSNLQANQAYVWMNGDVYLIPQTDEVEGAATGASFSGIGVENQPHQVLLNKIQWLYTLLTNQPHGVAVLGGNGTFIVPAHVTSLWIRAWGKGGNGGGSVSTMFSGGGGGGGGYIEMVLPVTPGQAVPYLATTFAQVGTAIAGAGGNGNPGTSSAFGLAGPGGTASGGAITFNGMGGEVGRTVLVGTGETWIILAEGGASYGCGHSHFDWQSPASMTGRAGIFPGQGGGGGLGGANGGLGYQAIIFIQW